MKVMFGHAVIGLAMFLLMVDLRQRGAGGADWCTENSKLLDELRMRV